MGLTDSLALPPNLPYAAIIGKTGAALDSAGNPIWNYAFSLTWKREEAILSPSTVYDLNAPYVQNAIRQVLFQWNEFERYIDPKPHDETNTMRPTYDVFVMGSGGSKVLNNDEGTRLFLRRCWPRSLMEQETMPTRDEWFASKAERVAEFKQAVKDIKVMMAAIEKSPLLNLEVDGEPILAQVLKRMGDYIAFPADPETHNYDERGPWLPTDLQAEGSKWKFI
jgi:hypothetical protein